MLLAHAEWLTPNLSDYLVDVATGQATEQNNQTK
jgi:hypothetical protein